MIKIALKDISTRISSGITPLRSNEMFWDNGTIYWLKTEQLGEKNIYRTNEMVSEQALLDTSLKTNPANTLSVAMYGEGSTRGKVSILKAEMATNQACCNLEIDPKKADYEYVYYFLKSQYNNLRNLSSGVRKNLNSNDIKNFEIWIPQSVNEQRRISSILNCLDAKIDLNNRVNSELEGMAKLIYDYWFVQFDFPISEAQAAAMGRPELKGKPYKSSGGKMVFNKELKRDVPEGWGVKPIREIANTGSGGTPLRSKVEYYDNGDIPWINSGELNAPFIVNAAKFITPIGLKNSSAKLFEKGTLLLAMYGATAGKVSLLDIEACTNQAICAIIPHDERLTTYLKFGLDSIYDHLINLSTGSARDNLSQDKVKDLIFAIPDESVLSKFDQISSTSFRQILMNMREIHELASLRDWLLPMLMNGQVRVMGDERDVRMAAEPEVAYNGNNKQSNL